MERNRLIAALASLVLIGAGCADTETLPPSPTVVAEFDPAASPPAVPTPTDLARDPATGRIQIPLAPDAFQAERDLAAYFASLDGYPPMLPGQARFSAAIDETTLAAGVRVIDLTAGAPIEPAAVSFDPTLGRLTVTPPGGAWPGGHQIAVVLLGGEGGLRGAGGEPVVASPAFFFARSVRPLATCVTTGRDCHSTSPLIPDEQAIPLEQLRLALAPLFTALEGLGLVREDIALAWTFTVSARPFAVFDPAGGDIPFPNDILRDPATGRVMLPVLPTDPAPVAELKQDLSTLKGFSTTAPVTARFVLPEGSSLATPGPRAVLTDLPADVVVAGDRLVLVPTRPLTERTTYVVAVTRALTSVDGLPAEPPPIMVLLRSEGALVVNGRSTVSSLTDEEASRLEPLRVALGAGLDAAGIPRDSAILAWSFTTQPTLSALADEIERLPAAASNGAEIPVPPGVPAANLASLRAGTFTGAWGDEVPYLLGRPANPGAPLVLFVHGLGGDKTEMLAVADTFAAAGLAVVAFDLPLTGDRASSGRALLDPADLVGTRDRLLQAAADLAQLARTAQGPGLGGIRFGSDLRIAGVSIGGTVAALFAAHEPVGRRVLLSTTGAPLVDVLLESPTLRPALDPLLEELGIQPGSAEFDQLVMLARWALDAGEPVNYARRLRDQPVLVQIASEDTVFPPDRGRHLATAAGAEVQVLEGSGSEAAVNPADPNIEAAQLGALLFLVGGVL